MEESKVNYPDHPCGTTHCHAGLFLIGCDNSEYENVVVGYGYGVKLMTRMLGFWGCELLLKWASMNAYLWGNGNGKFMFTDNDAFNGAKKPSQIADWWEAVADRIEAYNKKPPPINE